MKTEIAEYCSICGVATNAPPHILCERHGKKPVPVTEGRLRAIDASQSRAKATNVRWVVVFVPKTGSFAVFSEDAFRRDPPEEPHMVSDVADPFYLKPRLHVSPARVTTARPDLSAETPKVPGRTGTTQ